MRFTNIFDNINKIIDPPTIKPPVPVYPIVRPYPPKPPEIPELPRPPAEKPPIGSKPINPRVPDPLPETKPITDHETRFKNYDSPYIDDELIASLKDLDRDFLTKEEYVERGGNPEKYQDYYDKSLVHVLTKVLPPSLSPAFPPITSGTTIGDNNDNTFFSFGLLGEKQFDGKGGIDTVVYSGVTLDDVTIQKSITGYTVHVQKLSFSKQDKLVNIERLEFSKPAGVFGGSMPSKTHVALDLDGHAGEVVKVFGAVLGRDSITDKALIGTGLDAVDHGMSYEEFANWALFATGLRTSEEIITTLWTNVVGSAPTAEQAQPYIDLLENNEKNAGELVILAADTELNQTNIDLVGLAASGIEYII